MQRTLYRQADGTLLEQPERSHGGKVTQRYNHVRVERDGTRIFERTAEIPARSLATVGGDRPGRQFTKRRNKKAAQALPRFPAPPNNSVQDAHGNLRAVWIDRSKYNPRACAAAGKR